MIVVAAPASMLLQWQDELAQKFGLDFTIVDREHLLDTRRTRGFSANPWSVGSRFIVLVRGTASLIELGTASFIVFDPNDWSPLLSKSFEEAQRLGAYLRSTEWRTATAADRKLFQAPFRAGIRLDSSTCVCSSAPKASWMASPCESSSQETRCSVCVASGGIET